MRALLIGHGIPWSLVSGQGEARLEAAVDAVAPLLRRVGNGHFTRLAERDAAQPAWQWACETCDSPECEHLLMAKGPARR